MMLTKEQRAALAEALAVPWGSVRLICDGRRISLQVNRVSKTCLKYRVFTFIDGEFKGAWYKGDTPEAIKASLINSGYPKEKVDEAIRKLRVAA